MCRAPSLHKVRLLIQANMVRMSQVFASCLVGLRRSLASFHVVLAQPILAEVRREIERRTASLPADEVKNITANVDGWLRRIHREVVPWPSTHEMRTYQNLMPAVRHENDMASIVAAVLARPDWVLSTNTKHWNQDVAARTGLRIATPLDFLEHLQPRSSDTKSPAPLSCLCSAAYSRPNSSMNVSP